MTGRQPRILSSRPNHSAWADYGILTFFFLGRSISCLWTASPNNTLWAASSLETYNKPNCNKDSTKYSVHIQLTGERQMTKHPELALLVPFEDVMGNSTISS